MFGKLVGPWGPLICIYTAHLRLSVIHWPRHLTGSTVPRVFFFDQYYIIYYSVYDLISNLIECLGLKWLSVFSVGDHIRVWILFYFIILFYLASLFEISVCPKGFLLWPLVGTEKVGSSPLAPDRYKEFPFIIIFYFVISWIVLILAIWQLKSYSSPLIFYFIRWITRFSIP
jgi:hypothetical protein